MREVNSINTESVNKSRLIFLSGSILLIFIVLGFFISKGGLRGSDQYWYVADTESLLNGTGIQTNNILPFNIVNDSIVQNRGFIHNVPQIYIAAIPGKLFGAFNGWLILNSLSCILSAFLLFLTFKRFFSFNLSILVSVQFLVMPLTFWQSYQPLAESFQCLLLTSMLWVYYRSQDFKRHYIIMILAIVLLLCRNNYVLIVPVIAVLFYRDSDSKKKLIYSILYGLLIIVVFSFCKSFFPDTWNMSFYYTMVTSKVGVLNLSSFAELLKIYSANLLDFFKIQFFSADFTLIFYLPFNLLIIGSLGMWYFEKERKFNAPVLIMLFSLAFLLITTILHQNQSRYMLPFYPLVMFGFLVQLKNTYKENTEYLMVTKALLLTVILSLFINSAIAYKSMKEGRAEKEMRDYYTMEYSKVIPVDESVVFCNYNYDYILPGYLLRPRMLFTGNESTYLDTDKYSGLIKNYKINWLITKKDLGKNMNFNFFSLKMNRVIDSYGSMSIQYVYQISKNDPILK